MQQGINDFVYVHDMRSSRSCKGWTFFRIPIEFHLWRTYGCDSPRTMTHAIVPDEERKLLGLTEGVVQFSIGIEDSEDLIADLDEGLRKFGEL